MTEEKKEKTIYDLVLHETLVIERPIGGSIEVTRVAGGWLYAMDFPGYRQSPITFVPFDDDMKFLLANKK